MELIDLSQIIQNVNDEHYFIVDKNMLDHYRNLKVALESKKVFMLSSPEEDKNLATYAQAIEFFTESEITRNDKIIAIGGGATTDFAGFVAASVLRGIKWDAYPTTLLAMVDAAFGGKVGLNTKSGKNLVGSFHHPQQVYINHEFLASLSKEELISGYGEVIKYCFLDKEVFDLVVNKKPIKEIIQKCIEVKLRIVEEDYKESHRRKILNLGHTFGHCIEKCLNIPHGLAVIIGLKLIIDIYAPKLQGDFNKALSQFEMNLDLPVINFKQFENFLRFDKKRINAKEIELIIPQNIGETNIKLFTLENVLSDLKGYSEYATFFE